MNNNGEQQAPGFEQVPRANEARVQITWNGNLGDLPDPVPFDASEGDIKQWCAEAVRAGIPNVPADPAVDFRDYVVDRFPAPTNPGPNERAHAVISIRPKTPFGR